MKQEEETVDMQDIGTQSVILIFLLPLPAASASSRAFYFHKTRFSRNYPDRTEAFPGRPRIFHGDIQIFRFCRSRHQRAFYPGQFLALFPWARPGTSLSEASERTGEISRVSYRAFLMWLSTYEKGLRHSEGGSGRNFPVKTCSCSMCRQALLMVFSC